VIPDLTGLERRIAAFVEHGDPQPVLAPEDVVEARHACQGDTPPVDDAQLTLSARSQRQKTRAGRLLYQVRQPHRAGANPPSASSPSRRALRKAKKSLVSKETRGRRASAESMWGTNPCRHRAPSTEGHRAPAPAPDPCPRLPPVNPCQMVTISDRRRPLLDGVHAAQCENPTTNDKPQAVTIGKRGSGVDNE
jgi:hypothetical protein